MILSASGWRKIFASSGDEQDASTEIGSENTAIVAIIAEVFADYIKEKTKQEHPVVVCGTDTRPTGYSIVSIILKILLSKDIIVRYTGIATSPEVMCYAKKFDGFIYISASHNPIGHNGIKFGLNTGSVLSAEESEKLIQSFTKKIEKKDAESAALSYLNAQSSSSTNWIYAEAAGCKREALASYKSFIKRVVTSVESEAEQQEIFSQIQKSAKKRGLGIVCDMNGSSRSVSIDKELFAELGIAFYTINDSTRAIAHGIIPEGENLLFCAKEMERLQSENYADALLGYMPDCDGDRGNIVYWDQNQKKACILDAQTVFSLSVLSELCFSEMLYSQNKDYKEAIAVNGPTSMRIDEIAKLFNVKVFRSEVGEANVLDCAENARRAGYSVRICGEGSNGGNITYPSAVRDPLATLFAIIKLLCIDGLFSAWCKKTAKPFTENFSLTDIIESLPKYTTTPTASKEAMLSLTEKDTTKLKKNFQNLFEKEWKNQKKNFEKKYGIESFEVHSTEKSEESFDVKDFSKGAGLKIIFFDKKKNPLAFMWMRKSGTENVFRIMCDVKGSNTELENELLEWETKLLKQADK